jgi:hypothetical protein
MSAPLLEPQLGVHTNESFSWARPLILGLSLLSPVGLASGGRALAQEERVTQLLPVASATNLDPLESLANLTTPAVTRPSAQSLETATNHLRFS